MKGSAFLAVAMSCILSMPLIAQVAPAPVPASEMAWVDLDPSGAPGVKIATVRGDLKEGPFGAFLKLPAGFAAPLHKHTHEMRLAIVSGTYIQAQEGKPEFRLGPGSYLVQPGGDYRHTTACDKASDCVFYFESDGGFDFHVVEPGPAPGSE
ncbi:MAG: DUF4437 domain-containing protein [Gemmatimonadaceae bacterium]